ncbi:hypothetical protein HK102_004476 [Quaeritorhiza haematococci]|nr:hypothetical protein HK102_004476 [Quaeritorhiza haematococci]
MSKLALNQLLRAAAQSQGRFLARSQVRIPQCVALIPSRPWSSSRILRASSPNPSISLDPVTEKAQHWFEEGGKRWNAGDVAGALEAYEKSCWSKGTADAYFNVGNCNYALGKFEKAITGWERSLSLDPHRADAHVNLANTYALHLKDIDRATTHYEAAIRIQPKDGEIHFNYAVVLDSMGHLEKAIEHYNKAVESGIERANQNLRNAVAKVKSKGKAKEEGKGGDKE